ncbi:hypothetical protein ACFL2H_07040 [Planctomycetota bacterium]
MDENELKRVIQLSVVGTFVIASLGLLLTKANPFTLSTVRWISGGLTCVTIFWAIFFRWGWKCPVLKQVFPKPDLNGTWFGTLTSDWTDDDGNGVPQLQFAIVIRQSFLHIHATTFTDKFMARSYAESLVLDEKRGIKLIAYLYAQDTTSPGEENNREGAAELRVVEASPTVLDGRYWSNAKTNGRIKVSRVSNGHADDFQTASGMQIGSKS